MARRYVIEDPQPQEAQLRPVAAPVDTMIVPEIRAPELQNILDLSPLSKSFSTLAMSMAEGMAETTQKQAAAFYGANKEKVIDALTTEDPVAKKEKMAALTRSGKTPEEWSPLFWNSNYAFAARDLMRKYQDDLSVEIDKYAKVVDDKGNFLAEPPLEAEDVAAKLWQDKYAKNPVFANFFGQQEAGKYRADVEADFRSAALAKRAENLKVWRSERMDEEFGTILSTLTQDPQTAYPKLQAKIEEARAFGIPDLQNKLGKAVLAVSSSIVSQASMIPDPEARNAKMDEARDIITAAEDIQFGGSKLGDNPAYMATLDKAMEEITEREYQLDARDRRRDAEQVEQRSRELNEAGYKIINSIPKELDPAKRREEFLLRLDQAYGNDAQARHEALKQFAAYERAELMGMESNKTVYQDILKLISQGKLDEAETDALAALGATTLSAPDYREVFGIIQANRNARQAASKDDYYVRAQTAIDDAAKLVTVVADQSDFKNEFAAELFGIQQKYDDLLFEVSQQQDLTPDQRRREYNRIGAEAKSALNTARDAFKTKQDAAKKRLDEYKTNKVNLPQDELEGLLKYVQPDERTAIKLARERYTTIPEFVTNPSSGPIYSFKKDMQLAVGNIQALIGTQLEGTLPGNMVFSVQRAYQNAVENRYRELLPANLGTLELTSALDAVGRKAALEELNEIASNDPAAAEELRKTLKGVAFSLRDNTRLGIQSRMQAGQNAATHFIDNSSSFDALFGLDEDYIYEPSKALTNQIGAVPFDSAEFYEYAAEAKGRVRRASGRSLQTERASLIEDAAGAADNPEAIARNKMLVEDIITEAYAQTGLTLDEALSLTASGKFHGQQFDARLNATKIDPFYTPLLMDIPIMSATMVDTVVTDPESGLASVVSISTPTVQAIEEWFSAAEIEGSDENASLRKLMANFQLEYTPDTVNAFRSAQITAHQQYYKQ